jgi:endonuclease/exonuclease/phosphatase family metal-dependent hydrolase
MGARVRDFFSHDRTVIVYRDRSRLDELIRRVGDLPVAPDVICLQEVWAPAMQAAAEKELRALFGVDPKDPTRVFHPPYVGRQLPAAPADRAVEFLKTVLGNLIPHAGGWAGAKRRVLRRYTNSSGLMVVSRFPLVNPHFERYAGASKQEDQLCEKGALVFEVAVPAGERSLPVRMGVSHAYTRPAEALVNVERLADLALNGWSGDALVLGDLNIHAYRLDEEGVRSEYEGLRAAMCDTYGAIDVIAELAPDSYTNWPAGNRLNRVLVAHEDAWDDAVAVVGGPPRRTKMRMDPFGLIKVPDYLNWLKRTQAWRERVAKEAESLLPGKLGEILSDAFDPPTDSRELIDYVFLRRAEQRPHLVPVSVEVLHDWTLDNGVNVSDHAPVLVTFEVAP